MVSKVTWCRVMDVVIVVGTRPQHIKLLSLSRALEQSGISYGVVHTGQHYDYEMNGVFFEELSLPRPVAHLGVGSGSHGSQTARMILGLEKALSKLKPDLVVVPGDTNSALSGGLAAVKMGIPVAHVEAGLRSRDQFMPEEVNRIVLDHVCQLLFAPTVHAYNNLLREGVGIERAYLTGDVMADNIVLLQKHIDEVPSPISVERKDYVLVTVHRAENTDSPNRLQGIVKALLRIPRETGLKVIFPVHPRTRLRLKLYGFMNKLENAEGISVINPVSYIESLKLAKNASVVLTDSGGLQKEAFMLGTPVVTLRDTTEWVETVEYGWNTLAGAYEGRIIEALKHFLHEKPPAVNAIEMYGGGKASARIASIIVSFLQK